MSEETVSWAFVRKLVARMFTSHEGARDFYTVFGYPRDPITAINYKELYDRGGIANRIIRAYPKATWRDWPTVCDEDGKEDSAFHNAFEELVERMNLMHYLDRADRISGIGHYGVLLLGVNDNADLRQPLGKGKLMYLQPFAEYSATINQWDVDPKSPRFGKPLMYTLQTADPTQRSTGAISGRSLNVHYSRVIHIAESLEQDDVFGTPCLKPVINYLHDLHKTVGAQAEIYWLAANRGIALMADKDSNVDESMLTRMKEQAEEYQHQLRRTLVGAGMTAQALGSDAPDGTTGADTLLKLIAGTKGMPQRIMIGSEAGELSSSQDENNWNSRIDERRTTFAGPCILRPLVQKLIDIGELTPKGKWYIDWPKATAISDAERSTIAVNKTTALRNYVSTPGAEMVVAQQEVREWLDLPAESEYELEEPEEIEEPIDEADPDLVDDPKADMDAEDPEEEGADAVA